MSNINLLPENMRDTERRERIKASKKPIVSSIELSRGQKRESIRPVRPPKPSLWRRIFGTKKRPAPISLPVNSQKFNSSTKVDLLGASRKQKIKYKTPKPIVSQKSAPKSKKSFWSFLGPARSPINPNALAKHHSPVPPVKPPVAPKVSDSQPQQQMKVEIKHQAPQKIKKPKMGLLKRLKSLFSFKRKPKKVLPVNVQSQPEVIEPKKPKHEPSKSKEKFHMVPRSHKSDMDINLVPEELVLIKYKKNRQHVINIILVIIIPVLMIGGVYSIIDIQQRAMEAKIVKLASDRSDLISYINGFKDIQEKNIRLQAKLLSISRMLENHIYWTKFFSLLERYTLDDVYYTEFTADTSGKFVLPAVATTRNSLDSTNEQVADSYRKAAEQVVSFQQADDFVKSVNVTNFEVLSGGAAGIKGVKFELNVSLIDSVFNLDL